MHSNTKFQSIYAVIILVAFSCSTAFCQNFEFLWIPVEGTKGATATIAIDDKTFYSNYPTPRLYVDGNWKESPSFTDLHRVTSGDLVGAIFNYALKSRDNGETWDTLSPGVAVPDGLKKGRLNTLYIFRFDGIWQSEDEGETWSHSCPDAYFPGFSANKRTIQVPQPNRYYGRTSTGMVQQFSGNVSTVFSIPQTGNQALVDFRVSSSRTLYVIEKTIAGQILRFYRNIPFMGTQQYPFPVEGIVQELDLWQSGPLIHSRNQVFNSFDDGENWVDYTANLADTVFIQSISVTPNNTVYLTLDNDNVYKSSVQLVNVEEELADQHRIFPNPVDNTIAISNLQQPQEFLLFGIDGKFIETMSISSNQKINVSHLPSGRYYIQSVDKQISTTFLKR